MSLPSFSAVVFDMDGVIFDSERLVQESWRIVGERHGLTDTREVCSRCLGLNQKKSLAIFLEHYGADFPYEVYKNECRELFWGPLYGDHLPMKTGVVEILTTLKELGIPVALATSTSKKTVTREMLDAGILDFFDALVCGDMVTHGKPHPEIFLTACEKLGVAPELALAVEDSYNGIRAASAGGLQPIMVPDLLPPTGEIEAKCVSICKDLLELEGMIREARAKQQ